jgi:hypothetical protein
MIFSIFLYSLLFFSNPVKSIPCTAPKVDIDGKCVINDISLPKSFARILKDDFILYWEFLDDSVNLAVKGKRKMGYLSLGNKNF